MAVPVEDLLERLVRIPSPTGHEAEAVGFLQDQAREDGLRVTTDAAGNFLAEAGRGARTLLFVGHVDTVPGTIPVRRDGDVLWGRGTVDAKGCLVAAYEAARRHLDDEGLRVRIVGAVEEEGDSRGAKALDRSQRPDWILVGEPSGADGLTIGYKGILRGRLRVEKPVQHGGHPGHGAVETFIDCWSRVREELAFADGFHTRQGRLDRIASHHDGLTDLVHAAFQVRLPPSTSPQATMEAMHAIAARFGAQAVFTEALAAHVADRRTPLVAAFLATLRARGLQPHLKVKTGTADFNHLAAWFPGVPIAAYGPGDSSLDHTPEERIHLQELRDAVETLEAVLARLAALPAPTPASAPALPVA
ncbi:MAG TPA: M20/M25/M40 family metallo-hydrolase [Candidatus Thermoplasmatota archaeon]|nr:M20/M25/M40 family metallo-hydrolase [Candidatus Thermoplasmatota archaeon]